MKLFIAAQPLSFLFRIRGRSKVSNIELAEKKVYFYTPKILHIWLMGYLDPYKVQVQSWTFAYIRLLNKPY